MEPLPKHPRLACRQGTFQVRAKVPLDLLTAYAPRREVGWSLRTKDCREALEKVRQASAQIDREFAEARRLRDAAPMAVLSDAEIGRLVALYRHQQLAEDEVMRRDGDASRSFYKAVLHANAGLIESGQLFPVSPHQPDPLFGGMTEREFAQRRDAITIVKHAVDAAAGRGDPTLAVEPAEELLAGEGIALAPDSPSFLKLVQALLPVMADTLGKLAKRQAGEMVETPAAPGATAEPGILFSALWTRYANERGLKDKTRADFGAQVRRFIEVNGDLDAAAITKAHVREFKDALLRLPARVPNKLRGMTVPQIVQATRDEQDTPRLSAQTVNDKALGAVGAVLNYGVSNGFLSSNPAEGIKANGPKLKQAPRVMYADADLNCIFTSPVFTDRARPGAGGGEAAKWLPLLALFTGARLEELGTLLLTDVRDERGVPFLAITDDGEGKSLKNAHSRRHVPLHPRLIEIGFLDYVAAQRRTANPRLFPLLGSNVNEATASFSKWWGRYARELVPDKRKTFHSFRHSFKRALRDAGVDETLRDAVMGHATTTVAETYGLDDEGARFSLSVLAEALARARFDAVDLSGVV